MNENDPNKINDTQDPGQPGVTGQGNDRPLIVRGIDRRHMEIGVIQDEAALLIREKLVTAREDKADLREGKIASHEQRIRAAESIQTGSDEHMTILQEANERLVITTMETQKMADQLHAAKARMENAKLAAEQANLAKSEFLSSMSHELRTPLNAILGFAQLLGAGSPPPTSVQIARLDQITTAGWYLLDLINEILDLAVIESGKLSLLHEPVSLLDVMRECQAMIEPLTQRHDIKLTVYPFENTWFAIADRTRIKQVLINLLSNAIKYSREHGSVEVTCTPSTQERLRISIKDSGAGLSPEKLTQLFQPFNRLGQENGIEEGTGIGLVVTKQLVELMGGTIGVDSTVGMGSEFWIELIREDTP
ncbi:MAG: ATP-binding protein [Methylococcales bacterium]|nr:ATP-binding protein [Methylococcales bacterium]MDD5632229.1 ATP-binding protein [Methylococcales bacterium]